MCANQQKKPKKLTKVQNKCKNTTDRKQAETDVTSLQQDAKWPQENHYKKMQTSVKRTQNHVKGVQAWN